MRGQRQCWRLRWLFAFFSWLFIVLAMNLERERPAEIIVILLLLLLLLIVVVVIVRTSLRIIMKIS